MILTYDALPSYLFITKMTDFIFYDESLNIEQPKTTWGPAERLLGSDNTLLSEPQRLNCRRLKRLLASMKKS